MKLGFPQTSLVVRFLNIQAFFLRLSYTYLTLPYLCLNPYITYSPLPSTG